MRKLFELISGIFSSKLHLKIDEDGWYCVFYGWYGFSNTLTKDRNEAENHLKRYKDLQRRKTKYFTVK